MAILLPSNRLVSLLTGVALVASLGAPIASTVSAASMRLIIDGKVVTTDPPMRTESDRTLLPLRAFVEKLGVTPIWNEAESSVTIQTADRYVKVWIDKQFACLTSDCTQAAYMDVPARLYQNRTFLPMRFLANAVGANVGWDPKTLTATVTTKKGATIDPSAVQITSIKPGAVINGPVQLQATGASGTWVQFFLIDPATRKGPMVGTGADTAASYTWLPDPTYNGQKLLMAGVRDAKGQMQYSHPIPVTVAVNPTISLTGLAQNGSITGPTSFGTTLNFVATRQEYRLVNPTTGAATSLGATGPGDPFTYYPGTWHNGTWQIQAVAWDRNDREIKSAPITVQIATSRRFYLSGISAGDTLTTGTAALSTGANFAVGKVQYLIDGQEVGTGTDLTWKYGAAQNGAHTIQAVFTDKDGTVVKTDPVSFTVAWKPFLKVTGVSPRAIVTTAGVTMGAASNVPLTSVTYTVKAANGSTTGGTKGPTEGLTWVPSRWSDGSYTLTISAKAADGTTLTSESVTFKVYTGTVYDKKPLVPKEQYLDLVKSLAPKPYQQLGMSQAIQIAQALLETGWGQSIPVDKYTGQFSYNLFGIKGSGSAGSVTITTHEYYNGVKVFVDDQFRAYKSTQQGWDDHADFLMVRPWYAPFRAVMTDPIQSAWALKRSGYATDPAYPTKLINLMKQYNLFDLDQIQW